MLRHGPVIEDYKLLRALVVGEVKRHRQWFEFFVWPLVINNQ